MEQTTGIDMKSLQNAMSVDVDDMGFDDFGDAAEAFKLCTSIDAEDGPSQTFLARCREYAESPPSPDWDGVFELEDKG